MARRVVRTTPAKIIAVPAIGEPARSPYRMGLSYYPERPVKGVAVFNKATFGRYGLDLGTLFKDTTNIVGGFVAGGPVGAGTAAALDLSSAYSSGSQTDQQRAARANYFGNLAVAGNANAAQIVMGALVPNVSGNELPMWQAWMTRLQSTAAGQATLAKAQTQPGYNGAGVGPWWPVGSSDTVTNYPIMRAYAAAYSGSPLAALTSLTGMSSSTLLLLAGGGIALYLFTRRR